MRNCKVNLAKKKSAFFAISLPEGTVTIFQKRVTVGEVQGKDPALLLSGIDRAMGPMQIETSNALVMCAVLSHDEYL